MAFDLPIGIKGIELENGQSVYFVDQYNRIVGAIQTKQVKRVPRKLKKQIKNPKSLFWKKFYGN